MPGSSIFQIRENLILTDQFFEPSPGISGMALCEVTH